MSWVILLKWALIYYGVEILIYVSVFAGLVLILRYDSRRYRWRRS